MIMSAWRYCAFQKHVDPEIQSSKDKCVFCYRQSNVRRLLPGTDYVVWTVLDDLIWLSPSAVVGSWVEPPNIWLAVAKIAFVGWALNFRVRILLKSALIPVCKNSVHPMWTFGTVNSYSNSFRNSLFPPLKTGTCGLGQLKAQQKQSERVILRYHLSQDFNFGDSFRLMIF